MEDFARSVLFGTTLEEKLVALSVETGGQAGLRPKALTEAPAFPGRPQRLSRPGKASFPSLDELHRPEVRGEVLHFFANHELLAMELMALMLLRFPEAPEEFRLGVARTLEEEQSHLRLYLERMGELGVGFGDLPVSDYFWKAISGMKSPMDFVTQMSLTLEQANLDFSLFYMRAVAATGDEKTASILERVHREEIRHVKHGVTWFNRWRESTAKESDWEAYLRLLPPPMTARRAKGFEFSADSRRQAGLSERFIRELGVFSGSKGRPPVVWHYNPHCDAEIARGKPGFTAPAGAVTLERDLEHVPMFLALDKDTVLVRTSPRAEWLEELQSAGFALPEFSTALRAPKIGGVEPWGWSPDAIERFRPFEPRLTEVAGGNSAWSRRLLAAKTFPETGLAPLFSKAWSVRELRSWLERHPGAFPGCLEITGRALESWPEVEAETARILASGHPALFKAPYGTSGMQNREIRQLSELGGPIGGWARKTLESQRALVVEPKLTRVCDLSMQLEIGDEKTRLFPERRFFNGSRAEYRGTFIGSARPGFEPEWLRLFHTRRDSWHELARDLATSLRERGYRGPAGIDALIWRDSEGGLRFKPLVELNPRWTMGRVALELETHLAPGVAAVWAFLPLREIREAGHQSFASFVSAARTRHPLELDVSEAGARIRKGVIATSDPLRSQELLTVLATLPNPEIENLLPLLT